MADAGGQFDGLLGETLRRLAIVQKRCCRPQMAGDARMVVVVPDQPGSSWSQPRQDSGRNFSIADQDAGLQPHRQPVDAVLFEWPRPSKRLIEDPLGFGVTPYVGKAKSLIR